MRVIQTSQRSSPPGAPTGPNGGESDAAAGARTTRRPCSIQPASTLPQPAYVPLRNPDGSQKIARYVPPKQSDASLIRGTDAHKIVVMELQRKFSNQLGFLPSAAIDWYLEQGLVGIARENAEPCGYVLGRPAFQHQPLMRPITQAAVFMDAQRRHHGLALVNRVCAKAAEAGQLVVQCSCAADIDAVDFWTQAGFVPIHTHKLDNARGREIFVFRRLLVPQCPDWFWTPPPRSGYRARKK